MSDWEHIRVEVLRAHLVELDAALLNIAAELRTNRSRMEAATLERRNVLRMIGELETSR